MSKEPFAAKHTSLRIGGFFYWIIKGFKGKLINQYGEKYDNRNIWTGYFITLILNGIVVYFLTII